MSTAPGFRITCVRPCRISAVPKLQKWDLSLYRVCLLVYQVCVLSETLYSVQKLRVITGMHWTASLPQDSSPGLFPRTEGQLYAYVGSASVLL